MAGALDNIQKPLVPFIKDAEVKSYEPPMSDQLAYWFAEKFGSGDRSSVRTAKRFTDLGQAVADYGTLPLYFTGLAPFAAAVDAASGFVYDEPLDVALATIGIARPLKFVRQTMSDEAEAALSYAFGAGGLYMELENFLTSLGEKSSEK